MSKQITLNNIKQYIQGNKNLMLAQAGLKPEWYLEQIAYRMLKCQDCLSNSKCSICGCSVPGKLYVNTSCNNGLRFPDITNEKDWIEYKKLNNIN